MKSVSPVQEAAVEMTVQRAFLIIVAILSGIAAGIYGALTLFNVSWWFGVIGAIAIIGAILPESLD